MCDSSRASPSWTPGPEVLRVTSPVPSPLWTFQLVVLRATPLVEVLRELLWP